MRVSSATGVQTCARPISVAAGSTLDLDGGDSISSGTLGNAGTVDATGTNALHGMAITNSGTLESTGGVLTIDGSTTTFSNSGTLEAKDRERTRLNSTLT